MSRQPSEMNLIPKNSEARVPATAFMLKPVKSLGSGTLSPKRSNIQFNFAHQEERSPLKKNIS